jgi:transcriptional regulator with XRE-family HTH domain
MSEMHNLCMAGKTDNSETDAIAVVAGQRLRQFREQKGWTQAELARSTGWSEDVSRQPANALSPSRIGNFEQGTRRIGFEEAQVLEKLFHMPAAYFMGVISEDEARVLVTFHAVGGSTAPGVRELAAPALRRRTRS